MRKIALLLMIWPLLAVAQEETDRFIDEGSGLVVKFPEGWDRDTRREQGSIRFSAVLNLARSQYVQFEVSAVKAGYGADEWIAERKAVLAKVFPDADVPFSVDKNFKVGGQSAVLVTIGGKRTSKSGDEYHVRARYAGVANGDVFLQFQEMSYNHADEKDAKALQAMWDAISFQTPEGSLDDGSTAQDEGGDDTGSGSGGESKPVNTEPTTVEDKDGNFKLTLPPAWLVITAPTEGDDGPTRLYAQRMNDNGDAIGEIRVMRFVSSRAETFTLSTPTDVLVNSIDKELKWFEKYYGENTAGSRRPRVNEGILLGGAEKSGEYIYRGITAKEEAKIREAETLKRRGEKIEVPTYKEIVIRGRLALISPNIYFIEVHFHRSIADDEKMVAEYTSIMDSWEFASTEALPPPLTWAGKLVDNTVEECKDERKGSTVLTLSGRRPYKYQCDFVLPPGFKRMEEGLGANAVLVVAAQDERNNWILITILGANANQAGEQQKKLADKNEQFQTWASNWESKARGAKIPRKPQSVKLGISGKGYKLLEGDVEGHPGTFTGCLADKSGWRTIIEVETRGDANEVFKDQLKLFFKKLKFKKL